MILKKILFAAFIMHRAISGICQSSDLQRVIPPSPNVASLFKFIDEPISLYSGTPNIDIPVYTLKVGEITIPISLMYHAGGIKVTEDASWVGLGWALNAGGAITSAVNGLSDVDVGTKIMRDSLSQCDITSILAGNADSQKDLFYFNGAGLSGEFYLNDSNQARTIPYTKLKIQYNDSSWEIVGTDGMEYFFTLKETNVATRQAVARGGSGNAGGTVQSSGPGSNYPSVSGETWFLTKIMSPVGDSVVFNYTSYYTTAEYFKGETNFYQYQTLACLGSTYPVPQNITNYEFENINGWRLQSIVSRNGSIQFITGGNRCDFIGDSYLSEIAVNDIKGDTVRKFLLNYDYLIGSNMVSASSVNCSSEGGPVLGNVNFSRPSLLRRLMLVEVDQVNVSSNLVDNRYQLKYNTSIGLPSKFSSQQDTWGYYNENGDSSLLQNLSASTVDLDNMNVPIINGRSASLTQTEQGSLSEIVYPTGGSSSFVYELNNIYAGNQSPQATCGSTIAVPTKTFNVSARSNDSLLYTLTVNNCEGGDTILFQASNCSFISSGNPNDTLPYGFNVENGSTIIFSSNNIIENSGGEPGTGAKFFLSNGTYHIYSFSSSGPNCTYTITIPGYNEPQYVPPASGPNEITEGGLRIKQIIHNDPYGNPTITQNYNYDMNYDTVVASSGFLPYTNTLAWSNAYVTGRDVQCSGAQGEAESNQVAMMSFNSNTDYPLTGTHGAVVGYSQVTETKTDANGNDIGKTVYNYSSPLDQTFQDVYSITNSYGANPPNDGDFYPFAPYNSNEWQRGLLLKQQDYKELGDGNYMLLRAMTNYYSTPVGMDTTHSDAVAYYLNSTYPYTSTCTAGSVTYDDMSIFKYTPYRLYSQYQRLDSTITQNYDTLARVIEEATYYQYDTSNLLPSVIKKTNSKGEFVITDLSYPTDFTISGTPNNAKAQGIQDLQTVHDIVAVVEKTIQKENTNNTNLRTVSSMFVTYMPTVPLPDTIYGTESSGILSSFVPTVVTASAASISSYYSAKLVMGDYDGFGNVLQQQKVSDVLHSYIWDYKKSYPIAEVVNAGQSDIAYTSFEADGSGNWTIPDTTRVRTTSAITGILSYNLTGSNSITDATLNSANTYIVGYWGYSGNTIKVNGSSGTSKVTLGNWTYYEVQVTGATTVTISGTGGIDELRLYPKGALMTTYTYEPLVGITSQSDASDKITYYTYDGLGRLHMIQDQYGNILKRYDYEYQTSNQ
jgi:hypothetical protein